MTYDGVMVMPRNCMAMTTDEMEYVDGGWSGAVLYNNVRALASNYSAAARFAGLTPAMIAACATYGYAWACGAFGWTITTFAAVIGGMVAAVLAFAGAVAAVWYLGTYRAFY